MLLPILLFLLFAGAVLLRIRLRSRRRLAMLAPLMRIELLAGFEFGATIQAAMFLGLLHNTSPFWRSCGISMRGTTTPRIIGLTT
jgi:hypothetical protein